MGYAICESYPLLCEWSIILLVWNQRRWHRQKVKRHLVFGHPATVPTVQCNSTHAKSLCAYRQCGRRMNSGLWNSQSTSFSNAIVVENEKSSISWSAICQSWIIQVIICHCFAFSLLSHNCIPTGRQSVIYHILPERYMRTWGEVELGGVECISILWIKINWFDLEWLAWLCHKHYNCHNCHNYSISPFAWMSTRASFGNEITFDTTPFDAM